MTKNTREFGPARNALLRALTMSIAGAFAFWEPSIAGGIVLATNLNAPNSIVIDPNGRSIELSQVTQSPCNGELDAIPADGGGLTQISTSAALYDSSSCRGVSGLWFSKAYTIFGYGGYVDTNIDIANGPCGNNCTHLIAGLNGGVFLGALGTFRPSSSNAYFMENFSSLNSITVPSGTPTMLASGYFIRGNRLDMPNSNYPLSSSGLYFVDYNTSDVFGFNFSTGNVTAVIQGLPDEGTIRTDSRNVYWTDGRSIVEGAKGQTCSAPSCATPFSGSVQSLVVDESETDNPAGSLFFSDGANLWQLNKGGGDPQLMYAGHATTVLQTDGAQVYFSDGGALLALPVQISGSVSPLNLASIGTVSSSTLNDGFYWADDGDGSPGAGVLSYVAEQASQVDTFQYSTTSNAILEHVCSCKAAVYAALARYVLRAGGQYTAASGVKIDDFFYVGSADPCGKSDKNSGADWTGNGSTWINPVTANVKFGPKTNLTSDILGTMLQSGPVLIQDVKKPHWMLATNVATVQYDGGQATGIAAYDPLSGSKVLLDFNSLSSSYYVYLILDPLTNTWCSGATECKHLLNDINQAALKFSKPLDGEGNPNFSRYDLVNVLEPFKPTIAIGATVTP